MSYLRFDKTLMNLYQGRYFGQISQEPIIVQRL